MDCRAFGEWLQGRDAGAGDGLRPEALAAERHAADCPACGARLRNENELVGLLRQRFAAAPDGFTDAVMARLPARAEAVRIPEDKESPWPWWLQILFEPAAALGLALGLLYAVFAPTLLSTGTDVIPSLLARLATLGTLPGTAWLDHPAGVVAAIAMLGLALLGLFRGSTLLADRLTRVRAR